MATVAEAKQLALLAQLAAMAKAPDALTRGMEAAAAMYTSGAWTLQQHTTYSAMSAEQRLAQWANGMPYKAAWGPPTAAEQTAAVEAFRKMYASQIADKTIQDPVPVDAAAPMTTTAGNFTFGKALVGGLVAWGLYKVFGGGDAVADYGKASAGGYTIDAPCGLLCTNVAATTWWTAGRDWAVDVQNVVDLAATRGYPEKAWPFELQTQWALVQGVVAFFKQDPPWFALGGDIADWAAKQQTLRDFKGALGTWLATKGLSLGAGPSAPPVAPSLADSLVTLAKVAGAGVGAYLVVNLLRGKG